MSTTTSRSEHTLSLDDRPVHVVGGCHVGSDVASRLDNRGHTVHLHDPAPPADRPASQQVHDAPAQAAASFTDAGLDEQSVLLAISPSDSTNLLLAQIARTRYDVDQVIARVNDPRRIPAFEAADIETIDSTAVLGQCIADRC